MLEGKPYYEKTTNKVAVLNYHFFYGEGEDCNESICLDINIFKEHLSYLKENGFKTLTMEEFTKWMYKEIELPEKSVLITVDDGAKGTGKHNGNKLIPALEEYQMHATLFLISGWWDVENYRSKYLDIQSHTYDMHQYGPCKRGQLNCATYEEALKDLKIATGCGIKDGKLVVLNHQRVKIINQYRICTETDNIKDIEQLQGMLCSARQIEPQIFPSIYAYLKKHEDRIKKYRKEQNRKKKNRYSKRKR